MPDPNDELIQALRELAEEVRKRREQSEQSAAEGSGTPEPERQLSGLNKATGGFDELRESFRDLVMICGDKLSPVIRELGSDFSTMQIMAQNFTIALTKLHAGTKNLRITKAVGNLFSKRIKKKRLRDFAKRYRSFVSKTSTADRQATRKAMKAAQRTKGSSKEKLKKARAAYADIARHNGKTQSEIEAVTKSADFSKLINGGVIRKMSGVASKLFLKAFSSSFVGWGASIGVMFLQDWLRRYNRAQDGLMKARVAREKLVNEVAITGLQHESQLRQTMFRAEEEMDRKRFENLRSLAEMRTKMNEGDLAMQERLQMMEQQRLAAQKQGEMLRQSAGQAKDVVQKYNEYEQSEAASRDTLSHETGVIHWITSLFRQRNDLVDERGNRADASVERVVDDASRTKTGEKRALQSLLAAGARARAKANAAFQAELQEYINAYETFAETIASSQVGPLSAKLLAQLEALQKKSEEHIKRGSENQVRMTAGELYAHSFEENVQAQRFQWDEATQSYTYHDEMGVQKAVQTAEEYNRDRVGKDDLIAEKKLFDEEAKLHEEEKKIIEKKVSYQQASLALVQAQIKAQEELLKNLRDAVTKNYESDMRGLFDRNNKKTAADIQATFGTRADEMRRDVELTSNRFTSNAQAAEDYKLDANLRIVEREVEGNTLAAQTKEWRDATKKQEIDYYRLRKTNALEEHKQQLANQTKIFQTYIDIIKQQRDAYFRMMDRQLSREITNSTSYGRKQTDVFQDLQLNRIEQAYDRRKTNFESEFALMKGESDARFETAVKQDETAFKERQASERNKIERDMLVQKFNFEKELAKEEHSLRVDLIKTEYQIRREMDEAEKARNRGAADAMDKLKDQFSKEDLDKEANAKFKGKTYDELSSNERGELLNELAAEQRGAQDELLQLSGKKLDDYKDVNGNALQGDALIAAIKEDAMKAYNMLSEEDKNNGLGQRRKEALETFGNGVGGAALRIDDALDAKQRAANNTSIGLLDRVQNQHANYFDEIYNKNVRNEIELEKQKADLDIRQQTESADREEQVKRARMAHDAELDNMHQMGLQMIDQEKKQEEEGFKIGVRQIARHEDAATNAFTEKLGATEGNGYSAAILKERNERAFNNALDDLEDRQAAERRQAKANGATEEDMMKLEARQELERKGLENDKKISDTMLQRRIGSETGNTSDAMSLWEQIQASAFGHMEDPTVSAIDSLREQQKEQNDALLRASLDQMSRVENGNDFSRAVMKNTEELVKEAKKTKPKPDKHTFIPNPMLSFGLARRRE